MDDSTKSIKFAIVFDKEKICSAENRYTLEGVSVIQAT